MSTAIGNLCDGVRAFTNNLDYTDALITQWVRFAEERFNDELRDISMQSRDCAAVQNNIISLPPDWVETIWLRFVPNTATPSTPGGLIVTANVPNILYGDVQYGRPLRPCTPDEFFTITNDVNHPEHSAALYMINGAELFLNPALSAANGQQFEMGYFAKVPPLGNATTPLYGKSTKLYTYATCAAAALYDKDDDRVAVWEAFVGQKIASMNEATLKARYGTGPLHVRRRGFG